jgi:hypothetical protein
MQPDIKVANAHEGPETASLPRRVFYVFGGAAALILWVIFLIGATGMLAAILKPIAASGWFTEFQNNWLVVLFKVNLPTSGVQSDSLAGLDPLDLAIMVLFAAMLLSLYAALRRTSRVLPLVAVCLTLLGIPVFLATGVAGRSAVLVSGLIISIAMLRSAAISRRGAYIGIAASGLLFFGGDIATALFHPSVAVAALIGVGYGLWLTWLPLVIFGFLRLSAMQ